MLVRSSASLPRMLLPDCTFEPHFTVKDLAKLWRLSMETVRTLVKDEPDVVLIRLGKKKAHTRYSIPEAVARRIHTRLCRGPAAA